MVWLAMIIGAFAQQPAAARAPIDDSPEEMIVYGDHFARWDHTRWHVVSELILPLPLRLGSDDNTSFYSFAMQVRMVLLCDKDGKIGKKRMEIMCEIEDIGVQATSMRMYRREKDRERAQRVLDEIDAKLTGAKVQLQVDFKGGVNNVDLEGLIANNEREREVNENLRQLLLRVVAGFHMKIPDHAQRAGQWYEYNSKLMNLPSITASRGSTTMAHTVSRHKSNGFEYQIVQTLGQGVTAVKLPRFNLNNPQNSSPVGMDTTGSRASAGGSELPGGDASGPMPDLNMNGKEMSMEATYKLNTTGVAIFERETGIMTERVWVTYGEATASSAGGTINNGFRNMGQITKIGQSDRPEVGPTGQVAWPTQSMEGLLPWVNIDVQM